MRPKADSGRLGQRILDRPPFPDRLSIAEVVLMAGGNSGESFRLTARDGRRYKLRVCGTPARAARVEATLRRTPRGVFPRLLGRDRNYILMEYLEGDTVDYLRVSSAADDVAARSAERFYRELGVLHARMHAEAAVGESERLDGRFARSVDELCRLGRLCDTEGRRIRRLYDGLRREVDYEFSLDLTAVSPRNFLLTPERLYVVDEGSVGSVRGTGLAKLFGKLDRRRFAGAARWPSWKRWLIEGYRASGRLFLDDGYLDLLVLFMAVAKNRKQAAKSDRPVRRHLAWLAAWMESREGAEGRAG